jgi:hypothetical protein
MKRVSMIVFGASGRTGIELIHQALFQGHHVTAFVRRHASLRDVLDPNLLVIEGDLNNLGQVRNAMRGRQVVISTLGVSKTLHHDPDVVKGIFTITQAMKEENIHRMIYLSVFLANARPRQFSFFVDKILSRLIRKEIDDHEVKEKIVSDNVKVYTIVRATRLTNKPLTGNYHHGEMIAIRNLLPSVSRANVAHFILKQLEQGAYTNKAAFVTED